MFCFEERVFVARTCCHNAVAGVAIPLGNTRSFIFNEIADFSSFTRFPLSISHFDWNS